MHATAGSPGSVRRPSEGSPPCHGYPPVINLASLIAVPCVIVFIGYVHGLELLAHVLLVGLLLARTWLTRGTLEFQSTDYVVFAIAGSSLVRFAAQAAQTGTRQTAALFGGILLYLVVRTARHRLLLSQWTLFSVGGLGAIIATYSLFGSHAWIARAQASGFQDVSALKAAVVSVLAGPINDWATVLLLLLILQAATIRPVARGFLMQNLLVGTMMVPTAAALCLTFSRGAYLAAVAFAIGIAVLVPVLPGLKCVPKVRLVLAIGGTLLAGAVAASTISGGAVVRTAGLQVTEQQRRSTVGRVQVWNSALQMVSDHWLAGSGPGTFVMRYVPKAGLEEGRSFVGRPLNTALALFAEQGVIGLALQALLVLACLVPAVSGSFHSSRTTAFRTAVLAVGCAAFWTREMTFSSLLESTEVMCLYWLVLALFASTAATPRRATLRAGRLSRIALTVVVAIAAAAFYAEHERKRGEQTAMLAAHSVRDGDTHAAMPLLEKAMAVDPSPHYLSLQALARALDAMPVFDPQRPIQVVQSGDGCLRLEQALHDLDRALAANPDDDLFWHNRAWIRLSLGEAPPHAAPDLQRAIRIDGGAAAYHVSLGLLYESCGRTEDAGGQYALALAAEPDVCDSEFARDLRARPGGIWDAAVSKAIRALHDRDPQGQDVSNRARLARLYLELGQTERARTALLAVTAAMPQFPRAWTNLGRLHLESNDFAAADTYFRKAAFLDPGDPSVYSLLSDLARKTGDDEEAESLAARARMLAEHVVSSHAGRVTRVYKTRAVVQDDVLPTGLQKYCRPSPPRVK